MSERKTVQRQMEITFFAPEYVNSTWNTVKKTLPAELHNSMTFKIQPGDDKYFTLVWQEYESDEEYAARLEAES